MINNKNARLKHNVTTLSRQILISFFALSISLTLSMLLVNLMEIDPGLALKSMLDGAVGSKNSIAETIVKMSPLLFTGMSFAIAFRCGLTNLGMEGQLYMGAVASTAIAVYVKNLPSYIHIPLALFAAFIGGGLWGWIAGILKVKSGASEIITTVMMNTISLSLAAYLVAGPMAEPSGTRTQTSAILGTSRLPVIIEGTRAHLGFLIAIVFVILFWLFLTKSKKGFEIRMSGQNMKAAQYSGVSTDKNIMLVMFLAGGLAGLAGANEILGVQKMMLPIISPGYGFDGIAVSMIGMNSPFGIIVGALLFGMLRAGSNMMQMTAKVPITIISVIQGFVIITVIASNYIIEVVNDKKLKKHVRELT